MRFLTIKLLTTASLLLLLNGLNNSAIAADNESLTKVKKISSSRDDLPQHIIDGIIIVTIAVTGVSVVLGKRLSIQHHKQSSPQKPPSPSPSSATQSSATQSLTPSSATQSSATQSLTPSSATQFERHLPSATNNFKLNPNLNTQIDSLEFKQIWQQFYPDFHQLLSQTDSHKTSPKCVTKSIVKK
ncbi:MAG: hypothetical protein QNJ54_35660 [Prochloraceae cyanobacterium]|nr:hypothetical protein [Prochloraceae cyanobacterium]